VLFEAVLPWVVEFGILKTITKEEATECTKKLPRSRFDGTQHSPAWAFARTVFMVVPSAKEGKALEVPLPLLSPRCQTLPFVSEDAPSGRLCDFSSSNPIRRHANFYPASFVNRVICRHAAGG